MIRVDLEEVSESRQDVWGSVLAVTIVLSVCLLPLPMYSYL